MSHCYLNVADLYWHHMQEINLADLNQSYQYLQLAMEVGNVAWWQMDLPSGNIKFNENKTKMIGFEAKNFTHYQDFTKLVDPQDYEIMMKAMKDHLEGKKALYETEYRIKSSSGEYKWFYDRGRIVNRGPNGEVTVMGVVQDITDLKTAVLTLEAKRKELEELNQFMVNRELKMVELKKELEQLRNQSH